MAKYVTFSNYSLLVGEAAACALCRFEYRLGLIVRQLDTPAKRKREQKKNESLEAVYRSIEERLKNAIGTKATITSKGTDGAGKLELEFYNHDDLEKITERLLRG